MKLVLFLLSLLVLSSCTTSQLVGDVVPLVPSDSQLSTCSLDSDCIPLPSQCHPTRCINKYYESAYVKPVVCTEIFMLEAAYTSDDCACKISVCINKNAQPSKSIVPAGATKCEFRTDACTREFRPVCGWFKESVQCINAPCAVDANNPCMACANEDVAYWVEGACDEV